MKYFYFLASILLFSCSTDQNSQLSEESEVKEVGNDTLSYDDSSETWAGSEFVESLFGTYYELYWSIEDGDTIYHLCEDGELYWSLDYSENASDAYQTVAENHSEGQLISEHFQLYDYYFTYVNGVKQIDGGFVLNESISPTSESTLESWIYKENNILTNGRSYYIHKDHLSDFEVRECGLFDEDFGDEEDAR
jgi:hypothetical protein